jgi:hypothetical protein
MYPFERTEKQELEDRVALLLGDGDYDTWTTAELRQALANLQGRRSIPAPRSPLPASRPSALAWSAPDYFVRDGVLMARRVATDSIGRVHLQDTRAPQRVVYDGRTMTASVLRRYLMTGSWSKGPTKPFRAVVRDGAKTKHLGYFATVEERDAAVLTWRLTRTLT